MVPKEAATGGRGGHGTAGPASRVGQGRATSRTAEPATVGSVQAGRTKVRLLQRYPPDVNHENWPEIVRALAERGRFDIQDIDLAIFTQVRLPSIKLVMEDLGLPLEKTHWIMEEWGYMGSACIPTALDDAIHGGMERRGLRPPQLGDHVVFCASGGGLAMAATVWRWTVGW